MERMYLDIKSDLEELCESGFPPPGRSVFAPPSLAAAMNDASGTVVDAIEGETVRIEIIIAGLFS